jgi:two-component system response regulator
MEKYGILLEEDTDDWSLVKETLNELDMNIPIRFFSNSDEMFRFIGEHPKPALIMADYNALPDSGIEVLRKLKSDETLKEIPVVILSDSDLPHYKNQSYALGASSFIKKPDTAEGTRKKIGTFFDYWFDVVEV